MMGAWAFLGGSMGAGEIVLVFVVFLMLFGSKKLPEMARSLGRALEEFRRSARQMKDELMNAADPDAPPPPAPRPASAPPAPAGESAAPPAAPPADESPDEPPDEPSARDDG